MKRFWNCLLIACLAVLLAAVLSGCFGDGGEETTNPSSNAETSADETQATATTAAPDTGSYPPFGYVNASSLHIRPGPNTSGDPIGGLKFGDRVQIVGREGDWYVIPFQNGNGYISAQYVQETPPVSTTNGAGTSAGVSGDTTGVTTAETTAA